MSAEKDWNSVRECIPDVMTGSPGVELRIAVARNLNDVEALEPAWRALWRADANATIFNGYDWCITWARHYEDLIGSLHVVVCYEGSMAVGLAPLYITSLGSTLRRWLFPAPVMFLGTGEPEDEETYAEYMSPLSRSGYAVRSAEAIAHQLCDDAVVAGVDFHRVQSEHLRPLLAALERHWNCLASVEALGRCYSMPANTAYALSRLSPSRRSSLRRKLRRLQGLPGFELRVADEESVRALFATLVKLHQCRWHSKRQSGVFASKRFYRFHLDLATLLARRRELLLSAIYVDERPLAVSYCLIAANKCHYYQGGVDTSFYGGLSTGLLLHLLVAGLAGDRGATSYDLMLSPGKDYKSQIAEAEDELSRIRLSKRPLPQLFKVLRSLVQPLKNLTRGAAHA